MSPTQQQVGGRRADVLTPLGKPLIIALRVTTTYHHHLHLHHHQHTRCARVCDQASELYITHHDQHHHHHHHLQHNHHLPAITTIIAISIIIYPTCCSPPLSLSLSLHAYGLFGNHAGSNQSALMSNLVRLPCEDSGEECGSEETSLPTRALQFHASDSSDDVWLDEMCRAPRRILHMTASDEAWAETLCRSTPSHLQSHGGASPCPPFDGPYTSLFTSGGIHALARASLA